MRIRTTKTGLDIKAFADELRSVEKSLAVFRLLARQDIPFASNAKLLATLLEAGLAYLTAGTLPIVEEEGE